MPKLALYNMQGEHQGEVVLSDKVFNAEVREGAMHSVVLMQLSNRRRGTAFTKTRGEVRGGGRKPWRQKGTGRARHGTVRSPLWVGGSVTFGPRPRSYGYSIPKKIRRAAIRSALSAKVNDHEILVLDKIEVEKPRTKVVVNLLQSLKVKPKVLFVMDCVNEAFYRSVRNLPGVNILLASQLNVFDILNHDHIIFTKDALSLAEEVFA